MPEAALAQESSPLPPSNSPAPRTDFGKSLSTLDKLWVREFRFEGNTAFSSQYLASIIAPYTGREISPEDLEDARRQLTLLYVQKGYINSGALLNDQSVREGIVTFSIVEGKLSQLTLSGTRRYRKDFLDRKIRRAAASPFNVISLRDELEILRQNPNVRKINADVQPGNEPGTATLHVTLEEADPVHAAFHFDNQRPASIGAERLSLLGGTSNLTGRDDEINFRFGLTRGGLDSTRLAGLRDYSLSYTSPPFARRTNFTLSYGKNDSAIVEEPFRDLDISSRFENYSLGLRHIRSQTLEDEISFSLALEHRRSLTFLSGERFSFSRGDVDGEAQTTALRLSEDILRRNQNRVFAARGLLSVNAGFPGSTRSPGNADDHFVIALGQAQYVKSVGDTGCQVLLRASGQYASRPLLTVEQFSLGGSDTVRGYRENQLVRDMGLSASAEVRLPVARDKTGKSVLQLAPFLDFGYGKNRKSSTLSESDSLCSVGLGAIYTPGQRLNAQIYYGYALRDVPSSGRDLQDKGLTFSLVFNLF